MKILSLILALTVPALGTTYPSLQINPANGQPANAPLITGVPTLDMSGPTFKLGTQSGAPTFSTINGNTITTGTGTLTLGAGKTFTSSNTLTLAGTDGSTLHIGAGGTLGSAAYTSASSYQPFLTLTTTGTSGAATLSGSTLNIPQYSGGGSSYTSSGGITLTGSNFALGPLDNYGIAQAFTIPAGSIGVILGDSISAGVGGGTPPGELMSGLPQWANIPIYVFAISGSTSGPTSSQLNSGLQLMAGGTYNYTKYVNGASSATGTATVASMYSLLSGSGKMYLWSNYGTNDSAGTNGMTLSSFETSMASIWTTAHGYGANVVVVGQTFPVQQRTSTGLPNGQTQSWFNDWIRGQTAALQGSGAGYCDLLSDIASSFQGYSDNTITGSIWSAGGGGIHPSLIGEKLMALIASNAVVKNITYPFGIGQTTASGGSSGQLQINDGFGGFSGIALNSNVSQSLGINVNTAGGFIAADGFGDVSIPGPLLQIDGNVNVLNWRSSQASFFLANSGNGTQTGAFNGGVGPSALASLTSANFDIGFGASALAFTSTGSQNTAVGGNSALIGITTGSNNVAFGYNAGYNAGTALATESNCTFIGTGTTANADAYTNSTALGYNASITASNQMVYGNTSVTSQLFNGTPQFTGLTSNGFVTTSGGTGTLSSGWATAPATISGSGQNISITSGASSGGSGGNLNLNAGTGVSSPLNGLINLGTSGTKQINVGASAVFSLNTASTMAKFNSGQALVSAVAGTDYSLITVQTGTLVGGTATKTVPSGCHPWVQNNQASGSLTNVGSLTVTVSGTTATITSTNPLDVSPFTLFNAGSQ